MIKYKESLKFGLRFNVKKYGIYFITVQFNLVIKIGKCNIIMLRDMCLKDFKDPV